MRATPGGRAVLVAMRDDPELRAVDDRANRRYADGIDVALRARRPALPHDESRAVASVLMRSTVAVVDEAIGADADAPRLIATLQRMHVALLREVLDDRGTRRG